VVILALAGVGSAAASTPAVAATTSVVCPGQNLQTAISGAAPGDTILVSGTCTGNFTVGKNLTISGDPSGTLNGGATGTVLTVMSGVTASVDHLTVTNGVGGTEPSYGLEGAAGGILNSGAFTLAEVVVTGNRGGNGGNASSAQTFAGVGGAGGIQNQYPGALTVVNSSVNGNTGGNGGTGIAAVGGTLCTPAGVGGSGGAGGIGGINPMASASTISGNTGGTGGVGGVGVEGSGKPSCLNGRPGAPGGNGGAGGGEALNSRDSTVASNQAGRGGKGGSGAFGTGPAGSGGSGGAGGIWPSSGNPTVYATTIYGNVGGYGGAPGAGSGGQAGQLEPGGVEGPMTLAGTIVAGNKYAGGTVTYDCAFTSGTISSAGYNVIGSTYGCPLSPATGDRLDTNPNLGALQDNGGPTETQAPASGSPALDQIPDPTTVNGTALCPGTDQRGAAQPQGSKCDIGAVERAVPVAAPHSYSMVKNTPLSEPAGSLQVGVADANPDTSSWTALPAASATHGTATVNSDGSFTYTAQTDYVGSDTFSYTLTDAYGFVSAPAVVTLSIVAGPAIRISPPSGPPRTQVTVSGVGFLAGETVTVQYKTGLGSPKSITLCTTSAASDGTFGCNGGIPRTRNAGTTGPHKVVARGVSSAIRASTTFTLT
jgi:hypothetical protein